MTEASHGGTVPVMALLRVQTRGDDLHVALIVHEKPRTVMASTNPGNMTLTWNNGEISQMQTFTSTGFTSTGMGTTTLTLSWIERTLKFWKIAAWAWTAPYLCLPDAA